MTDYDNDQVNILTNCSYYYDDTTGVKELNQPSRIIINDTYLKSNMKDGAKKYYEVPPFSICQIMLANTLTSDYRYYFAWQDHSFAFWSFYKYASERNTDIVTYWN